MLSRVADSIYWMCRYIERAENIARFIDVNLHLLLDVPIAEAHQWAPLVSVTGDDADFKARYDAPTQVNVVKFLTFDRQNPNSIYSSLWSARENARSVREVISSEMWEQINRSYLMLRDADATDRVAQDPAGFLSHFKKSCHLFAGTMEATMTHGEAWHFGRMGKLIERAEKTSRILDVKYFMLLPRVDYVGSPYDGLQWTALLRSASAFEMYRKKHRTITPEDVAAFLILDCDFPRSMHYCVIKANESLHEITGTPMGEFTNRAEQRLGRLVGELDYSEISEIIAGGLHQYLDSFQARLNDIGAAIHESFFGFGSPVPAP